MRTPPQTVIAPSFGASLPAIRRSNVVLPLPTADTVAAIDQKINLIEQHALAELFGDIGDCNEIHYDQIYQNGRLNATLH